MKIFNLRNALGVALASAVLLVGGCGGGGGGGGSSSSPSTPAATTPTLTLKLTDTVSGSSTNTLSLGSSVRASATVVDAAKNPISNTIVTFAATPSTLAAITPVAATALTDANGVAFVLLAPASASSAGAGTLTAIAQVNSAAVSGSIGFSVSTASIGLSGMSVGQDPLSAYGTTSVRVNVTGVPTTYPVTVNFTSLCAASSKATLTASAQSVNGVATANYTDNKCAIKDTITASVAGSTVSTSVPLTVQAPGVASIQFISASPEAIVLRGTGASGYQEASLIKFKVVDNNNQAIENTNVTLDLSSRTGGILLDSGSGPVTKPTDANGEVQVSVQAGSNPTPVWVTATTTTSTGLTFQTQSIKLIISTGRPAQDRMSLAVGTHNIEGWLIDGTTTSVTARVSDRLGNPVPNGTGINFIANGGQIGPSCQTNDGACSVTFTSANPRLNGRVSVVAYTVGEESFVDANGDNSYSFGESFTDLGSVFIDNNENGNRDVGEQLIPFGTATLVCAAASSPDVPSDKATCDNLWGAAHVRRSNLITLSGSYAVISQSSFVSNKCDDSISFNLADDNKNPMPAGTKLDVAANTAFSELKVVNPTVEDSARIGGTTHSITLKRPVDSASVDPCVFKSPVQINLTVTSPLGRVTVLPLTITK